MTNMPAKSENGPNLQALGLKSPMEVIDILSMLKVDGTPIIGEDAASLSPQEKAGKIVEYFERKFNAKPSELPYIASIIKSDLKNGKIRFGA